MAHFPTRDSGLRRRGQKAQKLIQLSRLETCISFWAFCPRHHEQKRLAGLFSSVVGCFIMVYGKMVYGGGGMVLLVSFVRGVVVDGGLGWYMKWFVVKN